MATYRTGRLHELPRDAERRGDWCVYCVSSDGNTQTGGFAGHCDWRLPTSAELQTILLAPFLCQPSPCIDPVFGPTAATFYWSSTSFANDPFGAWLVSFFGGFVGFGVKSFTFHVRAVRGGS